LGEHGGGCAARSELVNTAFIGNKRYTLRVVASEAASVCCAARLPVGWHKVKGDIVNQRIFLSVAATLFLSMSARMALANPNLIVNGDFEAGTFNSFAGASVAMPDNWVLGPPSPTNLSDVNVDTALNPATDLGPESGTHYLRFQSTANNGSRDCVWQDIPTTPGVQYDVSFWVALTSTSVGNVSGLDPIWDENTPNTTHMGTSAFYFSPSNTAPMGYQQFSFTETASTSLTRLDFHAIDAEGSLLLDNVSVTAVPEPGALGLALGSVVLLWRKRTSRV
jgi:hypothetical protein